VTNKKIGIGVIGLNLGRYHLEGYLSHSNKCEVKGIADINQKLLGDMGKKYAISFRTDAYQELLKRKDIKAVSIVTPHYLHSPIAVEALNQGKHVLVEKPMAINVVEAQKMVEAARKNKRILMVAQNERFREETRCLKRVIEKGELGQIYFSKAGFVRQQFYSLISAAFLQKKIAGGGALIDTGVHCIDLAWWLMGCPEPVAVCGVTGRHFAKYTVIPKDIDVEDMAAGFVRFEKNITMTVEAHWASHSFHQGDYMYVDILGDRGGITWPQMKLSKEKGKKFITQELKTKASSWFESIGGEIKHFLDCIKSKKKPIASGQECITVIKIIEALYQSAKEGKEIKI